MYGKNETLYLLLLRRCKTTKIKLIPIEGLQQLGALGGHIMLLFTQILPNDSLAN